MVITSDIRLRGTDWDTVLNGYKDIFQTRLNYQMFILCTAIGIMYDKRIEVPEENGEEDKSVPRNVIRNNDNGKLDFMFQAAVLTTTTDNYTEEQRLDLAFGDEKQDFSKINYLLEFANYGAKILAGKMGDTTLETMNNLKDFLESSVEGRNFDIDALPDDILLDNGLDGEQ